jgi:hypothetical protein
MKRLGSSWLLLLPVIVSGQPETCTSRPETCSAAECRLFLAPSALGGLGVFSGIPVERFETIGSPDVILPIVDPYKKESSLLHSAVWNGDVIATLPLENKYLLDAFIPGLGTHPQCHEVSGLCAFASLLRSATFLC